jgi:hypothetical protein
MEAAMPEIDSTPNPWRQAMDAALVSAGLDCLAPGEEPAHAIKRLIEWETTTALDPAVSEEAQALIELGRASAPSVQVVPTPPTFDRLSDAQRDQVAVAVAEALGDALDCTRVWSAWSYGTMRDADFVNVNSDPERVAEIAAAAVNALAQASALPAAPQGVPPVVREAYEALFGASTLVTTSKMTASRYLEGCPAVLLIRFNSDEAAERAHKALRLLEDAAGGVNPSSAAAYWSATQPATPEPPQASAPSVQVAPHDDENDGLPSWVTCSEAVADGGATALQRFIDANEPADLEGAREFRQGLLAVIRGGISTASSYPSPTASRRAHHAGRCHGGVSPRREGCNRAASSRAGRVEAGPGGADEGDAQGVRQRARRNGADQQ